MEYLCPWESASFLGLFSSNVPRLLYYSHVPALLGVLFLGLFIFLHSRKTLATYSLLGIAVFFSLWNIFDLFLWATNRPDITMFYWSLQVLLEVLIFLLAFCFIYSYQKQRGLPLWLGLTVIGIILALVIVIPTQFNLIGVNLDDCTAIENTVAKYFSYIVEVIAILAISVLTMETYRKMSDKERAKEVLLTGIGIIIFLMMFIYGNLIGSFLDSWEVAQYGLFGMIVFIAFLVYLMVRFKAFNIKLIATEALVWALWIMIGAILFVAQTDATRIVTALTEILAIIFGIMLIKSVRREVEQREKLEQLTNELGVANDQLKDLNELKSQFVSFASHDLKSPINIIKQFATLIADGTYKEPAKVAETVLKIKSTADRATQMVDDFLDIRKIEEGKMDYNFEVKDIVSFVKGIAEDYAPVAKAQKNIDISFITTTPSINVKLDTTRFRQVIQNYLNNSVKYTEAGEKDGKPNWIKVMITDEQSTVLISIKDSGMGLSAELIPTLFEQFHRDKNTAKKIQGTGLGLYISKQIVHGHAGETWAESAGQGKGSTFFVRLKKA